MAEKVVKIGIIGAGGIAPVHINTFRKYGARCEVTAICDVKAEAARAQAEAHHLHGYGDAAEMLHAEKVDVACICTPPARHLRVALTALAAGCHVLSEKPLAMTVEEGQEIADAADRAGVLFMVAYCHRFHESILRIKRSIASGEFGPVTTFRNVFANAAGVKPTRGGNLMDNGSHAVDLMRYLLGDPYTVRGAQFRPRKVDDLDEVCDFTALLEGPGETMAYLEAGGRHAGGRFLVEVCGVNSSALYDYQTDGLMWCRNEQWEKIDLGKYPTRFERQAEHFLDSLAGKTACITDVKEAQKTMHVLDQIRCKAQA